MSNAVIQVVTLFAMLLSTAAFGEVFTSIQHQVPPSALSKIVEAVERAAARPPEAKEYATYLPVVPDVMVFCPAHQPDQNGLGCFLTITPAGSPKTGELSISWRKPIQKAVLVNAAQESARRTSEVDPNTTFEHLQFGNPLHGPVGHFVDGTHYFCAPEGADGQKSWVCMLHVSEMLSQSRNP